MAEEGKLVGRVTHYYSKIGVAIVELSGSVSVGDQLRFKGKNSDFAETLSSMQIEHESVQSAKKGAVVGIKVSGGVREGDEVYRIA